MLETNTDLEEAFSSQKRPSNTSKYELLQIIVYFCGSFLPSGFRIRIRIRIHRPDWIRIQYGSGSRIRIHNPEGDEFTLPSCNSVTLPTLQKGDGVTRFLRFSKPNFVGKTMCETRVSDPHWFNADPDTDSDPAFFLLADPDFGSGSRVWWSKIEKKLQLEI